MRRALLIGDVVDTGREIRICDSFALPVSGGSIS